MIEYLDVKVAAELVAEHYNLTIAQLKTRSRLRDVVVPRQLAMFLVRETLGGEVSYDVIGAYFNRDHATAIYACRTIKDLIQTDKTIASVADKLLYEYALKVGKVSGKNLHWELISGNYIDAAEAFKTTMAKRLNDVKVSIAEDFNREGWRAKKETELVDLCIDALNVFDNLKEFRHRIVAELKKDLTKAMQE